MLDPGHGGFDPGAVNNVTGSQEKDIVLAVCKKIQNFLTPDVEVVLSRSSDLFLSLSKRAFKANEFNVDRFLSIHCNSAENPAANGFEIFTTKGKTRSDKFATAIYNRFKGLGPKERKDTSDGDPDKEAQFTVLTKTAMPAALLELEFIHNSRGSDWLSNSNNQQQMARSIADGILDDFGITHTVEPPHTSEPPQVGEDTSSILARMEEDLAVLRKRFPWTS